MKRKVSQKEWHTAHEEAMVSPKADSRVVSFGLHSDSFVVTALKHLDRNKLH
jgi:hypothetical protein